MLIKITLALLFAASVAAALRFDPARSRKLLAADAAEGPRLRLMTWNVGYAELEADTRAQTKDMKAIAETILEHDPEAVALQELTGKEQLGVLLAHLGGRYRGAVARAGREDRVEAILVKDARARFEDVPAGGKFALGATFRPRPELPEIVLVSAHADAFNAARRRAYTEHLTEWTGARPAGSRVFVAGDFNFELNDEDESHFYTDNLKHDSESYNRLLKFFRDLGRDGGDTAINDRRIDYVFGPPGEGLVRRAEVLRGAAVGRMDHWPLLVEVAL